MAITREIRTEYKTIEVEHPYQQITVPCQCSLLDNTGTTCDAKLRISDENAHRITFLIRDHLGHDFYMDTTIVAAADLARDLARLTAVHLHPEPARPIVPSLAEDAGQ